MCMLFLWNCWNLFVFSVICIRHFIYYSLYCKPFSLLHLNLLHIPVPFNVIFYVVFFPIFLFFAFVEKWSFNYFLMEKWQVQRNRVCSVLCHIDVVQHYRFISCTRVAKLFFFVFIEKKGSNRIKKRDM